MRLLRFTGIGIAIVVLVLVSAFALEDNNFINDPETNEEANACYQSGSMAGKCNQDSNGDGLVTQAEIDWAWRCGWYLIRYENEIFSREMLPDDCRILIPNDMIVESQTNPAVNNGGNMGSVDSDGDGIPDAWELVYYTDLSNGANSDSDGDGCNMLCEYFVNTDPTDPDTDADSLDDATEVNVYFTNPRVIDTDSDTLSDSEEVLSFPFTNPLNPDTDGDGARDDVDAEPTNPAVQ